MFMKTLFILIILLACGGYGWKFYQDTQAEIQGLEAQVREKSPKVIPTHILCPTCKGEGRLSYVNTSGRNKIYACKVCGSRGYNTLVSVPPKAHHCPDCKAMGRIERWVSRGGVKRVDATRCARCVGQGWILPRSGSGDKGRTPGVSTPNPLR